MALVNCPECRREISDKVKACPHCGYPIENISASNTNDATARTVETTLSQRKDIKVDKSSMKKKLIIIFVLILIITAFLIQNANARYNDYIDNLILMANSSISGINDSITQINLTFNVWHNAIFKNDDSKTDKYTRPNGDWVGDFNEALANLFSDDDTKTTISNISTNQNIVKEIWRQLQNPPKGMERCYNIAENLYESYYAFTDSVISPSGSYNSYEDETTVYLDDFNKYFRQLEVAIPNKRWSIF